MSKIAIVCGAPSSEYLAPFNDPDWKIWVIGSRLNLYMEKGYKVDLAFEIHKDFTIRFDLENSKRNSEYYINWLFNTGVPLIVGETTEIPEKKKSDYTVFPYEESAKLIGSQYLTSTTAFMLAYAIMSGAEEIGLWGVDMSCDDSEHFFQRPCVEAWIGLAKGKGINVYIPKESPVLRNKFIEGIDGGRPPKNPPFCEEEFNALADVHKQKIAEHYQIIRDSELALNAHQSAVDTLTALANIARAVEEGQEINSITERMKIK
jgi:hypothetical protein